jgi:hypothetical protein
MCMQHSQFDAAKEVGDTYRANRAAGTPKHLSSPRPSVLPLTQTKGGRTGEYLHLAMPVVLKEIPNVSL